METKKLLFSIPELIPLILLTEPKEKDEIQGAVSYTHLSVWAIFHILVVFLQAFIFMLLTLVYLGLAHESH